MAQISYFEVATTVFVVTFSLNCARNGELPASGELWIRRQCTGSDDLTVPTLGLDESCDLIVFPSAWGTAGTTVREAPLVNVWADP